MSKVMIRKANKTDIEAIQLVASESWHATYEGIIPRNIQDKFLAGAYHANMLEKRLKQGLLLVAAINDKVVGFANFFFDETDAELAAIYLLPKYQNKGIGTALLEKGLAENPQVISLYINVEKENHQGVRFYKTKGFEVVSEMTEDFDGHYLQTVRMVLKRKVI